MKRTEELYHQNQINDIEAAIWGGPFSQPPKLTNMKWIEISKARSLTFQEPVFIKDTNGHGLGRLVEIKDNGAGKVWKFEVAQFIPADLLPEPVYSVTVSHVALPNAGK